MKASTIALRAEAVAAAERGGSELSGSDVWYCADPSGPRPVEIDGVMHLAQSYKRTWVRVDDVIHVTETIRLFGRTEAIIVRSQQPCDAPPLFDLEPR